MKSFSSAWLAVLTGLLSTTVMAAEPTPPPPPSWAYVIAPAPPPPPPDPTLLKVPGTDVAFTIAQIRDLYAAPDWHPTDHPPMPDVVAHGRKPGVLACGYCHLPNGLGRPENSSLAGLPVAYIVQQMADFKSGARRSAEPRMRPPALMASLSAFTNDAEVLVAAEYFASLRLRPWIKVVETDMAPKTRVGGGMLVTTGEGTEPIGLRIIEVPEDTERTEVLRDSKSGFIAYVPKGSIKKGERLVTTGANGKTVACAACHGADLRGIGPIPALAGRSPSYIFRQLYDLKIGVRHGVWSPLMKSVVSGLSEEDMINIAAYSSSREP